MLARLSYNGTAAFLLANGALGADSEEYKIRKQLIEKSNLKIAIVVDMWITGFDVPSMDTMYLDKPVETHNLIQTISRVNRVFKGKKEGLIVDYIGLEGAILTAMKLYNGDITPINGVDTSLVVFKDFLDRIIELMHGYDYSAFFTETISPLERLTIIQKGVEYVLAEKARKDNFMGFTLRCKKTLWTTSARSLRKSSLI